mgnify:CR=1 FL=1
MPHLMALPAGRIRPCPATTWWTRCCCPSRSAIFTGQYPRRRRGLHQQLKQRRRVLRLQPARRPAEVVRRWRCTRLAYRTALMGKYLNQYQPAYPKPPGWDEVGRRRERLRRVRLQPQPERSRLQHYGEGAAGLPDRRAGRQGQFVHRLIGRLGPYRSCSRWPRSPRTRRTRPRPALRARRDQQLAAPKTPAYDRLPANPPPWLEGPPAPIGHRSGATSLATFRKRVQDDLSVDDMIGQLGDELRAKGLDRNTYFRVQLGQRFHLGRVPLSSGKQTAFETDIRVPLIVSGPGVPAGRERQPADVQHRPGPDVRDPRGRARPGQRRRSAAWPGCGTGRIRSAGRLAVLIEHHWPELLAG